MILGSACTKTGPEIVPISTVQYVRIRVFSRGLTHEDHCHLLTIFDIENRKLIQNLSCIDASGCTYPDVFHLVLLTATRAFADIYINQWA